MMHIPFLRTPLPPTMRSKVQLFKSDKNSMTIGGESEMFRVFNFIVKMM